MHSWLQIEIENRISRYLSGQSSLAEFHNWLIPATWDIDAEPEPARRLAHNAQLLLAEFSNGDRTEDELRPELWKLIKPANATLTKVS